METRIQFSVTPFSIPKQYVVLSNQNTPLNRQ